MAQHNDYVFDLYRLTILDDELLFPFMGEVIRSNGQILEVLRAACRSEMDAQHETSTAIYVWGLRDYTELGNGEETSTISVTLARGTIAKDGDIFTPDTVAVGTSVSQPPPAQKITLIFQMKRHLVAVEFKSILTDTNVWLSAIHQILSNAAIKLNFTSKIELQAKPRKFEILKTFSSFQKLTRIRVELLLPNPELSEFTKDLYEDLKMGGIRTFIADMRNPRGLSQEAKSLPHAAAAMAEDGYKKDDVTLEGVKDGVRQKIKTGMRPARGRVEGIKDFVRGLAATAKTKDGRLITELILKEIDRTADQEETL